MKCQFCDNDAHRDNLCVHHSAIWDRIVNFSGPDALQQIYNAQKSTECVIFPRDTVLFGHTTVTTAKFAVYCDVREIQPSHKYHRTCGNKYCVVGSHLKVVRKQPLKYAANIVDLSRPIVDVLRKPIEQQDCLVLPCPEDDDGEQILYYHGKKLKAITVMSNIHLGVKNLVKLCHTRHCLNPLHFEEGYAKDQRSLEDARLRTPDPKLPPELSREIIREYKLLKQETDMNSEMISFTLSHKYNLPQSIIQGVYIHRKFRQ